MSKVSRATSTFISVTDCAYIRCDAKPTDLDGPGSHRRSHEKTDLLIKSYDTKVLWDDFGVRHNIVVCITPLLTPSSNKAFNSLSHILSHAQTFTNCSPLISFISWSKGFSRTTSLNGSWNIYMWHMGRRMPWRLLRTLIAGMIFFILCFVTHKKIVWF